MKENNKKCVFISLLLGSFISIPNTLANDAGGVALGATRLIYPLGDKQINLPISNTDNKKIFLIQSWVTDANRNKTDDFIVTPPLFTLNAKSENILRLIYTSNKQLPIDRETLFYFNSKSIPAIKKEEMEGNSLQIATQSVIKLFIRPKEIDFPIDKVPTHLYCNINDGKLKINNPTPYYVTLVNLSINNQKLENTMITPLNNISISIPDNGHLVSFQTINDYGVMTKEITCPIK